LRAGMAVASATPESGEHGYQQIGLEDRQSFLGRLGLQVIFFFRICRTCNSAGV